jgi:hypothetical protein
MRPGIAIGLLKAFTRPLKGLGFVKIVSRPSKGLEKAFERFFKGLLRSL